MHKKNVTLVTVK